ncbi:hypothetical protein D3C87_1915020 [compost metagenome]
MEIQNEAAGPIGFVRQPLQHTGLLLFGQSLEGDLYRQGVSPLQALNVKVGLD